MVELAVCWLLGCVGLLTLAAAWIVVQKWGRKNEAQVSDDAKKAMLAKEWENLMNFNGIKQ